MVVLYEPLKGEDIPICQNDRTIVVGYVHSIVTFKLAISRTPFEHSELVFKIPREERKQREYWGDNVPDKRFHKRSEGSSNDQTNSNLKKYAQTLRQGFLDSCLTSRTLSLKTKLVKPSRYQALEEEMIL